MRSLRLLILFFGALFLMGNASSTWGTRHATKAVSPTLTSADASVVQGRPTGIENFGEVNAHLYRGAQPNLEGYAQLKKLGIDTVVRFNPEGQNIAVEKSQVESRGMKFVTFPWSGKGEPTQQQVVEFLDLLQANSEGKTFVHCRRGADRTGVMVALYRLTADHWSAAQAVAEMRIFHYHHMWLPHLEHYVESFSAAMVSQKSTDVSQSGVPLAALTPNASH